MKKIDTSKFTAHDGTIFCPDCKKAGREDKIRRGPIADWYRCYACGWSSRGEDDPAM